ncbi:MAG TPA: putative glycolipid-binding domain-containing protein, partial [Thermoanaerobaculia bacterium]|nr:putative glycolipid-binding domain-containing protein [Thermoanaerobaculia bacterium]
LDRPGHEAGRLVHAGSDWRLSGAAVFLHEGQGSRLDYEVVCDRGWHTRSGKISGWVGGDSIEIEIAVDSAGLWRLNGRDCPEVAGCIDLDLNFSPSTNLLPIRRLDLAIGQEAPVRAAWLRFPSFSLEPLDQLYRRLDGSRYRYESAGGEFAADLEVDASGFVTGYPGFAERESG